MNGSDLRRRIPGQWWMLRCTAPRSAEDDLTGLLVYAGAGGTMTLPAGPRRIELTAWFDHESDAQAGLTSIAVHSGVRMATDHPEVVHDTGWLESTLRPRGPLVAGRYVVIDDPHAATALTATQLPILLPPGRAFGTGEHPTTAMCLELLGSVIRPGDEVLDLGTGSGILAIGAAKAGAARVLALDNDPHTVPVARENLELNDVAQQVELMSGSLREIGKTRRFQLIVANIHRTALMRAARSLLTRLTPKGHAILSGFSPEDGCLLEARWRMVGGALAARRERGEWCALLWAR